MTNPTLAPSTTIHVDTITYLIYLLYKANMLTRHNVQHMLDIIKKDQPVDVLKYLVEETKKI